MTRRPLRYLVAGGINTVVSYGSYAAALAAGLSLPWASALGVVMGIAVGFVTQGRYTFGTRGLAHLPRFVAAWAAMYGLHLAVVTTLQRQGVDPFTGGLLALVLITAISYFVLRDLVFRQSTHR